MASPELASPSSRALALAALAALVPAEDPSAEATLARAWAAPWIGASWAAGKAASERAPNAEDAALASLARGLGLSAAERLAVALAASVEEDSGVGRVLAWLQAPLAGSRPTLGLIVAALEAVGHPRSGLLGGLAGGPAARAGLLTLRGDGPLAEQPVSVPLPIALALGGGEGSWPGTTVGAGRVPPLPRSIRSEAAVQAGALGPGRALVIRSGDASEARAAAALVADALGRRPVFIDGAEPRGLGCWVTLRGLLPVFALRPAPGERAAVPEMPGYDGPVLVVTGLDGGLDTPDGAPVRWALPVPAPVERIALWRQALGPGGEALATRLGAQHRHGAGRIYRIARWMEHQRAVTGEVDGLGAALLAEDGELDNLAQPLRDPVPDEALVLPAGLRAELEVLLLRCRQREGLAATLGPAAAARYHPGVRALLVGGSGTGKTLAAGWLATKLGMPLYRVDLASITSKYIGETEKNLALLLGRAEKHELLLLFDEADALFGKRTEVRQSNDRYANAITNYLLQRIETFDGIALLTSNSRARFDPAFVRRLDLILEFPSPAPAEQRALWEAHLGSTHTLSAEQLGRVAVHAELVGGHIRSAALTAAALAREAGRPIGWPELTRGVEVELRKLGRDLPAGLRG